MKELPLTSTNIVQHSLNSSADEHGIRLRETQTYTRGYKHIHRDIDTQTSRDIPID